MFIGSNVPMTSKILLLIPALLCVPSSVDERKAVERAVLDYVEAIYLAKPELIRRSVHPQLQKIGYVRPDKESPFTESKMTYDALVKLSGSWNADGKKASKKTKYKIEILDLLNQMAVVKLTAIWGIDYMHLAKYEGKWKILHVMWQQHPKP